MVWNAIIFQTLAASGHQPWKVMNVLQMSGNAGISCTHLVFYTYNTSTKLFKKISSQEHQIYLVCGKNPSATRVLISADFLATPSFTNAPQTYEQSQISISRSLIISHRGTGQYYFSARAVHIQSEIKSGLTYIVLPLYFVCPRLGRDFALEVDVVAFLDGAGVKGRTQLQLDNRRICNYNNTFDFWYTYISVTYYMCLWHTIESELVRI